MFWAAMLGAMARVVFGYCLMARMLSLMPWNRAGTAHDGPGPADLFHTTDPW